MASVNIAALRLDREVLDGKTAGYAPLLLGAGACLIAVAYGLGWSRKDQFEQFAHSYLVSYVFFLSLALGAQGFILMQHVMRARWSVVVRRLAEMTSACIPFLALLFIPIVIHSARLYDWRSPGEHHLTAFKQAYYHPAFAFARVVAYFGLWWWLSRFLLRTSVKQDTTGDTGLTRKLEVVSAPALLVYAFLVTYFSFDVIMSLDVHWYSTMYGVYFFSGAMVGFLALLALNAMLLQRRGLLVDLVTRRHYHDVGVLLFAFVLFWAYIAYSQYMLIWYANIPEETVWVKHRQEHGWGVVAIVLLLGHFLFPFLGLMSRHMKRRLPILGFWSVFLLAMHWLDLYWQIMPSFSPGRVPLHALDAVIFLGLGAIMGGALLRAMSCASLVPHRDPRLAESLVGSH